MKMTNSFVLKPFALLLFLLINCLIILPLLLYPQQSYAIDVALAKGESIEEPRTGWLPYLFRTESLGLALGVGVFSAGKKQPQSGIFGTAYATSNDSDKDDFVTGISNDINLEFTLKYAFAMGSAVDDPVSLYYLDNGILSSGPQGGNKYDPWSSGKTLASATLFYRYRDLSEITREDLLTVNTAGIKVLLDHNNTDFTRNPWKSSEIYANPGLWLAQSIYLLDQPGVRANQVY